MDVDLEQVSNDGTQKRLYKLHDGNLIESVLMPYDDNRRTACISSQVSVKVTDTVTATVTATATVRQPNRVGAHALR